MYKCCHYREYIDIRDIDIVINLSFDLLAMNRSDYSTIDASNRDNYAMLSVKFYLKIKEELVMELPQLILVL